MRVAFDAGAVGFGAGGTATYSVELVRAVSSLRPHWELVIYTRPGASGSTLELLRSLPNARLEAIGSGMNVSRVQWHIARRLQREPVDIFHSLGYFLPLAWRGPSVVTVHDLNIYSHPGSWIRKATWRQWVDLAVQTPAAVHRADRVIASSNDTKRQLIRILRVPAAKVEVVHLAASAFHAEPATEQDRKEAAAIVEDHAFVLAVGALSPQKNFDGLIRAFHLSSLAAAGVRLVIAGDDRGSGRALRALISSLGVAGSVTLAGLVPDGALRALYAGCLCLVQPSHGEGFGLPLVEAMQQGAPLIAARRQALPEVAGDAGCFFEPGDIATLAALLSHMHADPGWRAEWGARSLGRRSQFTWLRAAQATVRIYEEVVPLS